METLNSQNATLAIAPLGAGDLIDRAIRLYRKNFFTFLRISSLPVIISAIGSVLLTIGWRQLFITEQGSSFAFYFLLFLGGMGLWLGGLMFMLMVMGGAARNLVRHLLWNEPLTMRETYKSLRHRFFSLLAATLIVGIILVIVLFVLFYGWAILFSFSLVGAALLTAVSQAAAAIVGIILSVAATILILWLFFLIAGRFAYVPQVLMVEGQGVFSSIGRSASLASGNAWRLLALAMFTFFAVLSALMILQTPLIWYAYINGIPIFSFEPDAQPIWFLIANQVIWQLSLILLAPVWMLGLSLLYVDERVRREAYDIELMAARQLGEMPPLSSQYINPLRPALVLQQTMPDLYSNQPSQSGITTLGLK